MASHMYEFTIQHGKSKANTKYRECFIKVCILMVTYASANVWAFVNFCKNIFISYTQHFHK